MSAFSIMMLIFGFIVVMNLTRGGHRRRRWERLQRESSPVSAGDFVDLERRLATVEQLEARVLELENRLDFTERLLTSRSEPGARA